MAGMKKTNDHAEPTKVEQKEKNNNFKTAYCNLYSLEKVNVTYKDNNKIYLSYSPNKVVWETGRVNICVYLVIHFF